MMLLAGTLLAVICLSIGYLAGLGRRAAREQHVWTTRELVAASEYLDAECDATAEWAERMRALAPVAGGAPVVDLAEARRRRAQ